jgi:hypothetical protein
LLLTGRCGVLLIDMAAVSTQPATLVEQMSNNFDVIVFGCTRADEPLLAPLSAMASSTASCTPASARRAGMFLQRRSVVAERMSRTAMTHCCHCCAACAGRLPACRAFTRVDRPGSTGADRAALRRRRT